MFDIKEIIEFYFLSNHNIVIDEVDNLINKLELTKTNIKSENEIILVLDNFGVNSEQLFKIV